MDLDGSWGENGILGVPLSEEYGLGKIEPLMIRQKGDVLFLLRAGSTLYFYDPNENYLSKITQEGSLEDIVNLIGDSDSLGEIQTESLEPNDS